MRRRLFDIVTIGSLGVCMGTLVLTCVSYWWYAAMVFVRERPNGDDPLFVAIGIDRGVFGLHQDRLGPDVPTGLSFGPAHSAAEIEDDTESMKRWGWFFVGIGFNLNDEHYYTNAEPLMTRYYTLIDGRVAAEWVIAISALLPLLWLWQLLRRRQRVKRGCCTTCGYDLRGSTARCPECGAEIEETDKEPKHAP